MKSFKENVLEVVRRIPKGRTMTYKEVAVRAHRPNAFRAVGSIMAKNFDPTVPCHRVIKSASSLGNYNRGGPTKKLALLKKEGALK